MQRCNGKTKTGAPCRAPAGSEGLCFFHANPEQAHTLGQLGGRRNRSKLPEPPPAGSLTAADLCDVVAEAIRDVRSKKMPPRVASALSQLANSAHRLLQTAALENRLAKLEQQLAEQESRTTSRDTDLAKPRGQEETCAGTQAQPGDVDTKESRGREESESHGSDERGEA
jgi:hypothetical protein